MFANRDYVMRLVKQLAEFIARALKLASAARPEEALATLRAACGQALGMEYEVLSMLDAKSAVELLGGEARARAFIQLIEAMGEVDERAHEPLRALTRYRHALDLAEALGSAPEVEARLRARLDLDHDHDLPLPHERSRSSGEAEDAPRRSDPGSGGEG